MTKRSKRGRQATTLDKKAHRRIKILAAKYDKKIEDMVDEAVFAYLKKTNES